MAPSGDWPGYGSSRSLPQQRCSKKYWWLMYARCTRRWHGWATRGVGVSHLMVDVPAACGAGSDQTQQPVLIPHTRLSWSCRRVVQLCVREGLFTPRTTESPTASPESARFQHRGNGGSAGLYFQLLRLDGSGWHRGCAGVSRKYRPNCSAAASPTLEIVAASQILLRRDPSTVHLRVVQPKPPW